MCVQSVLCKVHPELYNNLNHPVPPHLVTPLTLGMAVALTFAIVILQSDQTGDAAFVDSDLNGFGEVAEARMLYFCVWYCCTGVYSARGKYFFQAIEEAMISLCNPRELMALSDLCESAKDDSSFEVDHHHLSSH